MHSFSARLCEPASTKARCMSSPSGRCRYVKRAAVRVLTRDGPARLAVLDYYAHVLLESGAEQLLQMKLYEA